MAEYYTSLPPWAMCCTLILSIALLLLQIIALCGLFKKAGEAGWKWIIPIYNAYVFTKIACGNGWMFLLLLVPIANVVFVFWVYYQLSKAFGHGLGYFFGLVFLPGIFIPIIGLGKSKYIGPKGV